LDKDIKFNVDSGQRIAGNGAMVTLRASGRSERIAVRDLSRGGALLACDWSLPSGSALEVELPAVGVVAARVARAGPNGLALVFSSDPAALARIDRALEVIGGRRAAA
jgi:hypothetical protein